jgi:CDGSH-type Zn-finger protein/uncharacterized Fe-S cluster protein YjdI
VVRFYETDEIRVRWDPTRCIHTGICLRRLPTVFDVGARPWVDLSKAEATAVVEAVAACPTGALRSEAKHGVADEVPDDPTTVDVRPNGPLLIRGRLRIEAAGGRVITEETRVALCRCGASANKPFCDNSHRLVHFRDGESVGPEDRGKSPGHEQTGPVVGGEPSAP